MGDREVLMYSTAWCGYCNRARALFERKGIAFREVKVDEDTAERERMLARSNGRRTVPQIFIGATHVGGCDDLIALDRRGALVALLAAD